jgi:divalent metal cation (Fe/Co/Zn/Cd) transporter
MESEAAVRERAHAAALGVPRVREVHNVSVVSLGSGVELSLHLKLPGDLSLDEAHEIAEAVELAIREAVPEVSAVLTHIEPLG